MRRIPIVEGPYVRDILEQPATLRNLRIHLHSSAALQGLARKLANGTYRRVVLTGMGSSLYALYPLHLALNRHGVHSCWIETAELLLGFDALYRPDTLLIAVSQSGESAEITALLSRAVEFGQVLGITNHEASTLGRTAGTTLLLHAGVESTVSCKSYLNTLAALHWLRALLGDGDLALALRQLQETEEAVQAYLGRWREYVQALIGMTDDLQSLFITGRAESLATTATAGLILKESTRYPAEGMSCAAFRHGPLELIGPRTLVLVFAGDARTTALNRRLFDDIRQAGGRTAWAATEGASSPALLLPPTAPSLRPIVEILPIQLLSLALAARDGREAGRFERASKITTVA
jgi:glutamine---fructose-6-phosphate transaminase (isomerizing)